MKKHIIFLLLFLGVMVAQAQTVRYVKQGGAGNKNGLSWANASDDLQLMINNAAGNDIIVVAKGIYKPNRRADALSTITLKDRNNAFVIRGGSLKICGGFEGTEVFTANGGNLDALLGQRQLPSAAAVGEGGSILSGDFNGDDAVTNVGTANITITNNTENAYHVVVSAGTSTSILDGFTITGGNANGTATQSITVNGYTVFQNSGGGIAVYKGSPKLTNLVIKRNAISSTNLAEGGAIVCANAGTSPLISNSVLNENLAAVGSAIGILNSATPIMDKLTIYNNRNFQNYGIIDIMDRGSFSINNGLIYNNFGGSGIGIYVIDGPINITNATIYNNEYGGVINYYEYTQSQTITLSNSIIVRNNASAPSEPVQLMMRGLGKIGNCLIENGGASWVSSLGTNGGGNVFVYPFAPSPFVNAAAANFNLLPNSVAIDGGSNSLYTPKEGILSADKDVVGNPRVKNGTIDMGALESTFATPNADNILYVNANVAGGNRSGTTWANAIAELADALKYARQQNNFTTANPLKIYVAKGTYKPTYNAADGSYTTNGDRKNAFVMVNNVQIYGGFDPANGITALTDTRLLPSSGGAGGGSGAILSGDLGTADDVSDNAYHVVIASGDVGNALLDGFTIAGGNANGGTNTTVGGNSLSDNYGAGIYNFGSSAVYNNLVIKNNKVEWDGAGMTNDNASPLISNVLFTGNYAKYKGAAIINYRNSSPMLANATITGNTADYYSGIFNSGSTSYIYNSIIWNNKINGSTTATGADIFNDSTGQAIVKNSITQSYIPSNAADNNFVGLDPLFTNAATGDYTLQATSSVTGQGNNQLYWDVVNGGVAPPSSGGAGGGSGFDLAGNPRIYKYADGGTIDLGAYEYQGLNNPTLSNFPEVTKTYGDANFTLTPPTSNSNGAFTYTSFDTSVATISGSTVTINSTGATIIKATQAANGNYNAGTITMMLRVGKANPVLSNFADITKTYGNAPFYLMLPTSNSSGEFTSTSSDESVATISVNNLGGHMVTITGGGTATITVTQASTYNYTAGSISLTLTVNKATPTLSGFANISKTYGNAPFALTPPTSNSNGAFTYTSSDENVAAISGSTVTITGGGTATITATQAATANYTGGAKTLTLTVAKATTTLSGFANIAKTYGDAPFALTPPTSNSNGAFTYTSSNDNVAIISGSTVTITGAGIATITATQAATANYTGSTKTLTLTINKGNPALSNFPDVTTTYSSPVMMSYMPIPTTASSGAITYTSSNANVAYLPNASYPEFYGVGAGTATITATQAATANYNAGSISMAVTVNKGTQYLSFAAIPAKTTSSPDFLLNAMTNVSLFATISSSNPAVATITADGIGWKVHIVGAGTAEITASHPGNANYEAVSTTQTLVVTEGVLPVTLINFTAKADGSYAKMQWQTTSEVNNKGFEIYRSGDDGQFVKIGEVSALVARNPQPITNNFTDKTPLNGTNYYKLVQIDNDGTATELGIRTVAFNFQPSTFNLYPNPTTDKITAAFDAGKYHLLTLSDNLGRVLQQQNIGNKLADVVVALTSYPAGVYFITLQSANESITKKVIKR